MPQLLPTNEKGSVLARGNSTVAMLALSRCGVRDNGVLRRNDDQVRCAAERVALAARHDVDLVLSFDAEWEGLSHAVARSAFVVPVA